MLFIIVPLQVTCCFQILLDDVYKMKEEIQFLKGENAALLKRANEATSELFYLNVI